MGRRRRRVVRIVKKKLPTVFVCPRCGEEAVRVSIAKDTGHAVVLCALCNLRDEFPAHPAAQPIDVYSYFTDRFYGVKDPRPIIPHDREIQYVPSEEEPTEVTAIESASEVATESSAPGRAEPVGLESRQSTDEVLGSETAGQQTVETASTGPTPTGEQASEGEAPATTSVESAKESEEENEPFADILENKDKKRYSSTPLPQQSTEQTS